MAVCNFASAAVAVDVAIAAATDGGSAGSGVGEIRSWYCHSNQGSCSTVALVAASNDADAADHADAADVDAEAVKLKQ